MQKMRSVLCTYLLKSEKPAVLLNIFTGFNIWKKHGLSFTFLKLNLI